MTDHSPRKRTRETQAGFGAHGGAGGHGGSGAHGVALASGHFGCGKHGCGAGGRLCQSCLGKHGGMFGNPYGSIPHTPAMAGPGMGGPGAGGVPAYRYPYYTNRGPRDFLLDGCGPPPVTPYVPPRKLCLPSIGY